MNFPKLVSNQFVRAAGAVLLSVLGFGISSPQCVAQPAAPVATPVPAPRSPEAEKAIRDYYAQISVPSYRQETDFAIAKLAPDYTETGQDGKLVHRAEAVQAMLAGETYFVNPMQCQFVIRSFKWHGEHAVVEEDHGCHRRAEPRMGRVGNDPGGLEPGSRSMDAPVDRDFAVP